MARHKLLYIIPLRNSKLHLSKDYRSNIKPKA